MNNIKCLVTGGTGFVGSHLIHRLVRNGCEVHIIKRFSDEITLIEDIIDELYVHNYDEKYSSLNEIFSNHNIELVFHLASFFVSEHKAEDIDVLIKSNILLGTQLIEAMLRNNVRKIINTGTSWQHYHNENYNPVNLYSATKQAFENILKYYYEAENFSVINLKLFDTYGPNDNRPKLFNALKNAKMDNLTLDMSKGEQLIDLVFIDDVIDAYILVADEVLNNKIFKSYSLSSNEPISLKELVLLYQKIADTKLNINWGGKHYRKREVMIPWENGVIPEGWHPKINLINGLAKIV